MKLLNTAKKITTAAALVAAMLAGTAPKAAACPYTVGPLGRYIAPAIVQGMTVTDDGAFLSRRRRGQILHFTE